MIYRAYFHEAPIPLIIGMTLSGFGARISPSTGTHDNPMIKCLALDDGKEKTVFVHLDLLGYSADRCERAKKAVSLACGAKAERISISCTHTHSAPTSMNLLGTGDERDDWHRMMEEALIAAIVKAYNGEGEDVTPELYRGENSVSSINRVTGIKGDIDTDVFTLVLRKSDGKIHTVYTNFACHCVTTREKNLLYSRDYPYYFEKETKRALGDDVNFIFANGCCGDTNPSKGSPEGFEMAKATGKELAKSLTYSLCEDKHVPVSFGEIKITEHRLFIPIARRDGEKDITELKAYAKKLIDSAVTPEQKHFYPYYAVAAENMEKNRIENTAETGFDCVIKHITLGEMNIVLIPFETFHGIGRKVKKLLGDDRTLVFELGDGNFGYIADEETYDKSYYEMKNSYMWYAHSGTPEKGSERLILKALKSGE